MGCLPSKFNPIIALGRHAAAASEADAEDSTSKTYSWDKRKKVDPAEYTIENISDSEEARLPGSINGQQFIIQNCKSAKIYLFDYINTITIDDCTDCSLYIGPVSGSLFIRNCKNCTLFAACGQFRTRDCQKMDVFLYCQTKPIIEASTKIRFACFQSNYPQLNDHFKMAKLNIFNNNWSEIHDFTPVEGEKNYTMIKEEELAHEKFPVPQKEEFAKVGLTFKSDASLVPLTGGAPQYGSKDVCLIICFYNEHYHDIALDIISKMRKDKFPIQYTREVKMEKGDVHKFFGGSFLGKMAQKGPVVALLCVGKGVVEECKKTASMLNSGKKNPVAYTTDDSEEGVTQIDLFFTFSIESIGI